MKTVFICSIIAILLSFPMQDHSAFRRLKQLEGSWKMQTDKHIIYEHWKITSDTEMMGKSYALKGADSVLLERIKLAENRDGVYYVPSAVGQNRGRPVSFRLVDADEMKFVFENKGHDFPQRIIYHLIGKDSLHAWIEGKRKGQESRSDFYFRRIN